MKRPFFLLVFALCHLGCSGGEPARTPTLPGFDAAWGPHETYLVAAPNNVPLRADVYYPMPATASNQHIMVTIHGGGWSSGDRSSMSGWERPIRQAGYTVISIEYRLTPSVSFIEQVQDCREAMRWVARYARDRGLNADAISVMGVSAGAHLATLIASAPSQPAGSWIGERTQVRPAAVIGISGAYDVRGDFAADKPAVQWMIGDPGLAKEASPVTWLDASDPPMLIMHGDSEREPITPLSQAEIMVETGLSVGAPMELVVVKQGDHGLFPHPQFEETWPTQEAIGESMVRFLDREVLNR